MHPEPNAGLPLVAFPTDAPHGGRREVHGAAGREMQAVLPGSTGFCREVGSCRDAAGSSCSVALAAGLAELEVVL